MNNLVIDLTHGGVKIAISLAKKGKNVLAYDIYNTLNSIDARMLEIYNVELVKLEDLSNFKGDMNVIYPIHMPLTFEEIKSYNPDLNYTFQTHHEIIKELLSDWGDDILKVEITGVKGKTSSVFMLKEVLIEKNPLILSSLGALLFENENRYILKRNISITPANIKETIDLAYKIANPVCQISEGIVKSENLRKYDSAIFESSLGVSGIGDVGLLLNIVEDYPIAKGRSSASQAKKQVFRCNVVVCEKEAYDKYYSDVKHEKTNTFSLSDETANLYLNNANYTLDETTIDITYNGVKTINDNIINGKLTLKTFAPGKHNVSNVLGVILTALSLEIDADTIMNGIKNYKGIPGRTNKKLIGNSIIIEEINPGINVTAIKESINMINNLDDYYVAIGGDYGITCEEIDEKQLSEFIDTLTCDIILTGDVGRSISEKISKKCKLIRNYEDVYDIALENNKNLLFIYRSDYRKLSQR
ncbi:UDP-N-acetylmuramyl peptide synthase [Methanobrevibacter sp. YE315]|uniref:coenzyme F430 synthase n=1 Tax=Methanobrevibacter sp. YE315 TaxID=1609968 RepID=UPI000764E8F9|nr:coenzyme F430 synthase [Methanobrevibacter sp. YE315]AMD18061.1 UDP-N-acetylmuramyl peptide synthase [Methanobrevibacter sp. YE315]